jgi:hypothetical protein
MHSTRLTLPNGWSVSRIEPSAGELGPNNDDLMAIADAVREVAASTAQAGALEQTRYEAGIADSQGAGTTGSEIGRRGHLRSIPTDLS